MSKLLNRRPAETTAIGPALKRKTSAERAVAAGDRISAPRGTVHRQTFANGDPVLGSIRRVRSDLDRADKLQRDRASAYREDLRQIVLGRSR